MSKVRKFASCHKEKPYYSRGLCKLCYDRVWAKNHSRQLREFNKQYRLSNVEKIRAKKAVYNSTTGGRYRLLVAEAKKRELYCDLPFVEYCELVKQLCFYCEGSLPVTGTGLDRIDSDLGYVSGNVRPCCRQCNVAKNGYTEIEFKEWLGRVTKARWFNSNESIEQRSNKAA